MPAIREELYLADKFSGTLKNFDAAANASIDTARAFQNALNDFTAGFMDGLSESLNASRNELSDMVTETERATAEQDKLANSANETGDAIKENEKAQANLTAEVGRSENASNGLLSTIKKIATAVGAVKLAKTFIDTADEMAQIGAKLNLINDGFQTTAELQQMIYDSAQRTRSSYMDTATLVARLGMNTGDTFGSNREMITFAENLNKSFKVAGASAQEQSSVILQMSQALASGVLRGQEFNAVMSGAPNIIKNIADYMGVSVGQMRDLAAEGKVTSDIIKNAMLGATENINSQFETIPQTFSDVMTTAKNTITTSLTSAFDEWIRKLNGNSIQGAIDKVTKACEKLAEVGAKAFEAIVDGLAWVSDNWEALEPVIEAAISMILMYKAINIASSIAVGAAWAVAHAKIIASLGLLYVGFQIAKNIAETLFDDTPDIQKGGDELNFTYKYKNGTFDGGEVKSAYEWDKDGGLATAEAELAKAEKDLESTLDSFKNGGISYKTYAELMSSGNTTQDAAWYAAYYGRDTGYHIDTFKTSSAVEEIKDNGVKIKGEVKLSDEDVKIFRDLAEGRYMTNVNLETLAPNVSVTVEGGSALTAEEIADAVAVMLVEQRAERTAIAH